MLGCSTAGELTERGRTRHGVALLLVAPEDSEHRIAFARGLGAAPEKVAASLGKGFSEAQKAALQSRYVHSTTIVLTDGLSGSGEAMIEALLHHTDVFQQIVGGAAGDDGAFQTTLVGTADEAASDAAAALHVFASRPWGVGVGHGLEPSSERLTVTRASANVVFEIDEKPAFEAYRSHAHERGVELRPEDAAPYLIGNELGVYRFGELIRARLPSGSATRRSGRSGRSSAKCRWPAS